ncbi:MAG TPA: hypothetical protein VLH79_05465 [Chthonomonadales bacterium]|nr:hypothetical protein [Chthonomonadales bacterium]
MNACRGSRLALALLTAWALRPVPASGQSAEPSDTELSLSDVTRTYSVLRGLHVRATITATGLPTRRVEVRWRRSDRIFVSVSHQAPNGTWVRTVTTSDGTHLWRYRSDLREAVREPAPETTFMLPDAPYDLPELRVMLQGDMVEEMQPFLGARLARAAPAVLLGVSVETIHAAHPSGATARIAFGLFDRLVRSYRERTPAPPGTTGTARDLTITYSMVNGAPTFTDADFTFTPPSGTRIIARGDARPSAQRARREASTGRPGERHTATAP